MGEEENVENNIAIPKKLGISPEERERIREEQEKDKEWAKNNLKIEWLDEHHYRSLASKYKITLARWWKPASELKYIKRALKAVDKDAAWWKDKMGVSIKDFAKLNPSLPAWVAMGIVLELAEEETK